MQDQTGERTLLKDLAIGYCLGTANIIPGVSGGTFLLIFRIYERVFSVLANITRKNLFFLVSAFFSVVIRPGDSQARKTMVQFLIEKDFFFLFKLIIGSLVAIVSLSALMEYLMIHHFSLTYALFFGLILVSLIIPVKMLKKPKAALMVFLAMGAAATIYVTWAVNPYEKAVKKSALFETVYQQQTMEGTKHEPGARVLPVSGKYSPDEYLYAALCGAVAISAMVLPGVSGSLVLILMGAYFEVVSAISGLKTLNPDDILFLSCFGLGMVFGGLFFARLVSSILKRYYDATMAFLTGLMGGSLYALWPFKKSVVMAEQYIKENGVVQRIENTVVYTNINELPDPGMPLLWAAAACLAGGLIMCVFVRKEIKG